jgi:hypothetical protein
VGVPTVVIQLQAEDQLQVLRPPLLHQMQGEVHQMPAHLPQ